MVPTTARTRLRQLDQKGSTEREALDAILDAARVAHVAFTDADAQPFNIPVASARDGDRLLLHGSTGSRMFRTLAAGVPVCASIVLLDGLVLARSAFESSMQYRSAVIFGTPTVINAQQKPEALRRMVEAWMPGRWAELRPPTGRELAATLVVSLLLKEWSVKTSALEPEDPTEDLDAPVWAGVLPIDTNYGSPRPAADLRYSGPVPDYLSGWTIG
jgi:uncharacterized protein